MRETSIQWSPCKHCKNLGLCRVETHRDQRKTSGPLHSTEPERSKRAVIPQSRVVRKKQHQPNKQHQPSTPKSMKCRNMSEERGETEKEMKRD